MGTGVPLATSNSLLVGLALAFRAMMHVGWTLVLAPSLSILEPAPGFLCLASSRAAFTSPKAPFHPCLLV